MTSRPKGAPLRHVAPALFLSAPLSFFVACAPAERDEDATTPPVVEGTALDYAFQAPAAVPPGWVTLELQNAGEEEHFLVLWKLPEGKTIDDYRNEVGSAFGQAYAALVEGGSKEEAGALLGRLLPEWYASVQPAGGPGFVSPGRTARTTVELEPAAISPGALEGRVRLAGEGVPGPTRVANTTDPAVCGEAQSLEDLVVSPGTRGLRHVIVALAYVPPDRAPPAPPDTLVLDNRDCRFVPHAAVLTTGSTVVTTNSDPTLHTVHFYGPLRSNIALPVQGMRVTRTVRRPGLLAVRCDVHGWMQAYIRVDDHPFHAVTDGDGRFRIDSIPPGEYTVEFWHERLGRTERSVTIESGVTAKLEVEFVLSDWTGPSTKEESPS